MKMSPGPACVCAECVYVFMCVQVFSREEQFGKGVCVEVGTGLSVGQTGGGMTQLGVIKSPR